METTDLLLEQCRTGSSPCGPADVWAHSVTGMKIQPITACVSEARETQMSWISGQNQLSSPSNKSFLHSALADYQIQIEIRLQMTSGSIQAQPASNQGCKTGPKQGPIPMALCCILSDKEYSLHCRTPFSLPFHIPLHATFFAAALKRLQKLLVQSILFAIWIIFRELSWNKF